MDPTRRFTETVGAYVRHRPDYPPELLRWLAEHTSGRRAVDLGAGTGIFSRQLAAAGFEVTAVEPNAAMRAAASDLRVVDGTAERTGLPDGCADLVTGAQAFHWFDLDRALPEITRILAAGGRAAAVWNDRVNEGFAAEYDRILWDHSEPYRTVARPGPTIDRLLARIPDAEQVELPHGQRLDLPGLVGRAWSSSYVVHGVRDRAAFDAALARAFAAHAVDGEVTLGYRTRVVSWVPVRPGA